jgi:hypothetical protein
VLLHLSGRRRFGPKVSSQQKTAPATSVATAARSAAAAAASATTNRATPLPMSTSSASQHQESVPSKSVGEPIPANSAVKAVSAVASKTRQPDAQTAAPELFSVSVLQRLSLVHKFLHCLVHAVLCTVLESLHRVVHIELVGSYATQDSAS